MKGNYKTTDGALVRILEYDEPNKIVYAKFQNGDKKWIGHKEYSLWKPQDTTTIDISGQMEQEKILILPESHDNLKEDNDISKVKKGKQTKKVI